MQVLVWAQELSQEPRWVDFGSVILDLQIAWGLVDSRVIRDPFLPLHPWNCKVRGDHGVVLRGRNPSSPFSPCTLEL